MTLPLWPGRLLARTYALRAAVIWTMVHLFAALVSSGEMLALPPLVLAAFLPLMGVVGILDSHRRSELLFLRNLGLGPATVAGCWIVTLALLEAALFLTGSALA